MLKAFLCRAKSPGRRKDEVRDEAVFRSRSPIGRGPFALN